MIVLSSTTSLEKSVDLEDICWLDSVMNGWPSASFCLAEIKWGGKRSLKALPQVLFPDVFTLDYTWSAPDILEFILNEEWYRRKMWRHNTCGTSCPWWCLFLSPGDLDSEKYSYTVMFIPSSGLITILRWSASQRRATSQPQSSLWIKSLKETKGSIVYKPPECCRLKEEIQQKPLYSGQQRQQAVK